MNTIELCGLHGSNPLHALASLGALVVTDALEPGCAALGWRARSGTYVPVLRTQRGVDEWSSDVAGWLQREAVGSGAAGDSGGKRRLRELKSDEKKLLKQRKQDAKRAREEAKRSNLRGAEARVFIAEQLAPLDAQLQEVTRQRAAAELERAAELGFGFAHLGDVIEVPIDVFRMHVGKAISAGHDVLARHLAALASDASVENGAVVRTPFSFSNGGSGQLLLKDWRSLAQAVTPELLNATIVGNRVVRHEVTSLNWDPEDLREAALRWSDPAGAPKKTHVAANALAYLGLGLLTAVPSTAGIEATAFDRGFSWPIWEPELPRDVVAALLASDLQRHPADRSARGILTVFTSKMLTHKKRNYFAPATPR